MKRQLLIGSSLFCAAPGLAMLLLGPSSLIQILGIVIIVLAAFMVPFGLLATGGIAKFAWIVFGFILFVLILASGYIPLAGGFSLGFDSSLIEIVSLCVVIVEIGIIFSTMFGNYKVYSNELKKAGYDEEEFHSELHTFDKFLVLLAAASAGISFGIYFLFSILPAIGIDALTGLVITAIVYFVIARYLLTRKSVKNPS